MTARSQKDPRPPKSAFTRVLDITTVRDDGLSITIEADSRERAAIAAEIGLRAAEALKATYRVDRLQGDRLEVSGELEATIVETCVVSLEAFECEIRQPIALTFAPQAPSAVSHGHRRSAVHIDPPATVHGSDETLDPPDPIIDDRIDLGAVAIEFLNLARDPYPKKPDAHFQDVVAEEHDSKERSPFAMLERLKDRQ